MWLNVFNPGQDGKNYRHQLHRDIEQLEREVERLQELCEAAGINYHNGQDIPF